MSLTAWTTGVLGMGAIGTIAHGVFIPQSRVFGDVISRGPRDPSGRVALTFDDGPHPSCTPAILDILGVNAVPATFFMIGRNVGDYPDLARRVAQDGHLIANHSMDHNRLGAFRGIRYWESELIKTNHLIERITGQQPRFFRPPMGIKSPRIMWASRRCKMSVVTWSRRGLDGVNTSARRILNRFKGLAGGDILVLHDGVEPGRTRNPSVTAEVLPELISIIRDEGLTPVRLDHLLADVFAPP